MTFISENTVSSSYKDKSMNAAYENNRCFLWQ